MRKDFVAFVSESFSDFLAEEASLKVLYPGPRIDHIPSHARLARLLSRTFPPLSGSRTNPSLLCGPLSRRVPLPGSPLAPSPPSECLRRSSRQLSSTLQVPWSLPVQSHFASPLLLISFCHICGVTKKNPLTREQGIKVEGRIRSEEHTS